MKVKDLLKTIKDYQKKYGKDFLEFNVYTEQCTEGDKIYKRKPSSGKNIHVGHKDYGQGWGVIGDSEDWEYFEVCGYNTVFTKEKIFTINVNY